MEKPPSPMRLTIQIPIVVTCSGAECGATHQLPGLPLVVEAVDAAPIVDRREVARALPPDWKVGAMRPIGVGLFLKDGPPPDAKPMPVVFCPACGARQGRS